MIKGIAAVMARLVRRSSHETKEDAELRFQKRWQKYGKQEIDSKVREYWRKYRYLDDILASVDFTDKTILDVGCGVVSVLHIIDNGCRIGVDPLFIEYHRTYGRDMYGNILGVNACGEKLPFKESSFDVVFCSNVLDHVDRPGDVVSEVKRVLRSDGKLVLTVDVFETKTARDVAHPHSLTEEDVSALLGAFRIRWSKKSKSRAQVCFYFDDQMVESKNVREQIVVAERIA